MFLCVHESVGSEACMHVCMSSLERDICSDAYAVETKRTDMLRARTMATRLV